MERDGAWAKERGWRGEDVTARLSKANDKSQEGGMDELHAT